MDSNDIKSLESRIRSLDKAIRSYGHNIRKHRDKLKAYQNNPDAKDNKGFLKNATSSDIRRKIIQARSKHLHKEVRNFQASIKKAQLEKRSLEKRIQEIRRNQERKDKNPSVTNQSNDVKKRLAVRERYSSQSKPSKPTEIKPTPKEISKNQKRKI